MECCAKYRNILHTEGIFYIRKDIALQEYWTAGIVDALLYSPVGSWYIKNKMLHYRNIVLWKYCVLEYSLLNITLWETYVTKLKQILYPKYLHLSLNDIPGCFLSSTVCIVLQSFYRIKQRKFVSLVGDKNIFAKNLLSVRKWRCCHLVHY